MNSVFMMANQHQLLLMHQLVFQSRRMYIPVRAVCLSFQSEFLVEPQHRCRTLLAHEIRLHCGDDGDRYLDREECVHCMMPQEVFVVLSTVWVFLNSFR